MSDPSAEDRDAAITLLGYDPIEKAEEEARVKAALEAESVQMMTMLHAQLQSIRDSMARAGAPEPKAVIVHPSIMRKLKRWRIKD